MSIKKIETLNKHENPAINENEFDIENYMNTNWDKIKEVVNNNADEVIKVQEYVENLNSENELLKDQIPQGQDNGENITLNDSSNMPFKKFIAEGNSEQESRSGKNRLPYPYDNIANAIIQDLGDGRLILNGTIDSNTSVTIKTFDLKAGAYKFLFNSSNLPNNSYFYIRNQNTTAILKTNIKTNTTFTLEEDTQIRIYLVLTAGTYSNYELDLMVLDATEEDETWESYGAMPSSKYPSKIQNVEGNVNVTIANKNIIGGQWITGFYNISGNLGNVNGIYKCFKKFLKAGTYAYSYNADIIRTQASNLTTNTMLPVSAGNSFTLQEDAEITLGFRKTDRSIWDLGENLADIEFQIEKGNTSTDYVPHQQQTATFPLSEGQKLMKGDYLAENGIHHKRKQIEVDGTNLKVNDVIKYTNGLYYCKVSIPFTSIDFSDGYSTHFKWVKSGIAIGNCYVTGAGKGLVFILEDQNITTVEGANNWLIQQKQAGTPVKFECELAEEEIEAYTDEQQTAYEELKKLATYKNVTNIFSTDEISPIFDITYFKDLETMFNNLSKAILEGGN